MNVLNYKAETNFSKQNILEKPNDLGKSNKVETLRKKEDIQKMFLQFDNHIKKAIENKRIDDEMLWRRNKLMFFLGINLGLRGSDLCNFRWLDILDGNNNLVDHLRVRPKKTTRTTIKNSKGKKSKKSNKVIPICDVLVKDDTEYSYQGKYVDIFFIEEIKKAIEDYMKKYPNFKREDYIFRSRKGNKPIQRERLCRIIQQVADEAGVDVHVGSHTLRKTFGYWRYKNAENKTDALVKLQKLFGHNSTSTTMFYIGIGEEELLQFYNSTKIGVESFFTI